MYIYIYTYIYIYVFFMQDVRYVHALNALALFPNPLTNLSIVERSAPLTLTNTNIVPSVQAQRASQPHLRREFNVLSKQFNVF